VDDVLRRHDEPYCGTIATKAHYNSVICGARDVDYNAILPTGFAVKRPVSEGPRPSGGRRKGVPNRVGGDLRLAIVAAIQETGFIMQSGLLITTPPRLTSDERRRLVPSMQKLILQEPTPRLSDSLKLVGRPLLFPAQQACTHPIAQWGWRLG
jgi:hypothetical protein